MCVCYFKEQKIRFKTQGSPAARKLQDWPGRPPAERCRWLGQKPEGEGAPLGSGAGRSGRRRPHAGAPLTNPRSGGGGSPGTQFFLGSGSGGGTPGQSEHLEGAGLWGPPAPISSATGSQRWASRGLLPGAPTADSTRQAPTRAPLQGGRCGGAGTGSPCPPLRSSAPPRAPAPAARNRGVRALRPTSANEKPPACQALGRASPGTGRSAPSPVEQDGAGGALPGLAGPGRGGRSASGSPRPQGCPPARLAAPPASQAPFAPGKLQGAGHAPRVELSHCPASR